MERETLAVAVGRSEPIQAQALDGQGRAVSAPAGMRWFSLDPQVARVNEPGRVVGDRPGVARVVAAVGVTKADTATVVVTTGSGTLILEESFDGDLDTARWEPFGDPASRVLRGAGLRGSGGFHNHGDQSHESGIALRRPLRLDSGLTLEYWARFPVTGSPWQKVIIGLWSVPAESFHLGPGQPFSIPRRPTVITEVPAYEPGAVRASLAGTDGFQRDLPRRLRDGGWHRYRLVLYPFGEVRWFADGEELTPPVRTDPRARSRWTLTVGGRSVASLVLVDDVKIWEGVLLDPAPTRGR